MRISTRAGRGTYVSMGCLGWTLTFLVVLGVIGWVLGVR
jgi:hypothetical protein